MKIRTQIAFMFSAIVVFALIIAGIALTGFNQYLRVVEDNARFSKAALLSEQANRQIFAVVMESRGIYMSDDPKVLETFAKRQDQELVKFREIIKAWTAMLPAEDQPLKERLITQSETFIKLRSELSEAGRREGNLAARKIGDNDLNRAARTKLNQEMAAIAELNNKRITQATELAAEYRENLTRTIFAAAAFTMLVALTAFFASLKTLTQPIMRLTATVSRIAAGDHQVEVMDTRRRSEIGTLATTILGFRDELAKIETMRRSQIDQQQQNDTEQKALRARMAHDFEQAVGQIVAAVASSSSQLRQSAESLSHTATEASTQSQGIATASDEASSNVEEVSVTANGITASIEQIGAQTEITANQARRAVSLASDSSAA